MIYTGEKKVKIHTHQKRYSTLLVHQRNECYDKETILYSLVWEKWSMTFPNVSEDGEQYRLLHIVLPGAWAEQPPQKTIKLCLTCYLAEVLLPRMHCLEFLHLRLCVWLFRALFITAIKIAGTTSKQVHTCKQRKVLTLLPAPKLVFLDMHSY